MCCAHLTNKQNNDIQSEAYPEFVTIVHGSLDTQRDDAV